MSYLPVNPCCTDVAINNHCGSTNNSNQCGTNITLSSNKSPLRYNLDPFI